MSSPRSPDHSPEEKDTEETSDPDNRPERNSDDSQKNPPEQEHSDLVNVLGVLTIVFGVLKLLCGLGLSSGVAFYSSELKELLQEFQGVDPELTYSVLSIVILAIAILFLIIPGLLQIVGGAGVLKRKNWARILLIVLGGLDAFLALPQLLAGNLIGFAISGGWGAFTLFVLLSDPYQTEFYSRSPG